MKIEALDDVSSYRDDGCRVRTPAESNGTPTNDLWNLYRYRTARNEKKTQTFWSTNASVMARRRGVRSIHWPMKIPATTGAAWVTSAKQFATKRVLGKARERM